MNQVKFQYKGLDYTIPFDRTKIRLGKIFYIRISESSFLISEHIVKNSTKVAVTWIAPSVWAVQLIDKYSADESEIKKCIAMLKDILPEEVLRKQLDFLASSIPIEKLYKSSTYDNSKLRNVLAVCDRLEFINNLKGQEIELAIALHWQPLVMYHILTCFDLLGQPHMYLTFDQWIISKSKEIERNKIINSISQKLDSLQFSQQLFKEYSTIYGVKVAFIRFIREILPPDCRVELLSSIKISENSMPPLIYEVREDVSLEEKEKFLFQLRNNYTHKIDLIYGFGDYLRPSLDNNYHVIISQKMEEKYGKVLCFKPVG